MKWLKEKIAQAGCNLIKDVMTSLIVREENVRTNLTTFRVKSNRCTLCSLIN